MAKQADPKAPQPNAPANHHMPENSTRAAQFWIHQTSPADYTEALAWSVINQTGCALVTEEQARDRATDAVNRRPTELPFSEWVVGLLPRRQIGEMELNGKAPPRRSLD